MVKKTPKEYMLAYLREHNIYHIEDECEEVSRTTMSLVDTPTAHPRELRLVFIGILQPLKAEYIMPSLVHLLWQIRNILLKHIN